MLTIRKENFRDDEINVILDGLVPENHLVRKIENAIDFSFIYDKVKDLYSPLGAPSIDPVVLIKIMKDDLKIQIYLNQYLKKF